MVPTEPGWCRVFMGNLFKGNVVSGMWGLMLPDVAVHSLQARARHGVQ